jgi:hypothetical protein
MFRGKTAETLSEEEWGKVLVHLNELKARHNRD